MRNWPGSGKKIALITLICSLITAFCAVFQITRSVRPSIGKPYEMLTAQEAREYMSYEENYLILDVRDREKFEQGHLNKAINIPYDILVAEAPLKLTDLEQTIYVYGDSVKQSCSGAQKLSDMGYKGIAEIGSYDSWIMQQKDTETEDLMSSPVE